MQVCAVFLSAGFGARSGGGGGVDGGSKGVCLLGFQILGAWRSFVVCRHLQCKMGTEVAKTDGNGRTLAQRLSVKCAEAIRCDTSGRKLVVGDVLGFTLFFHLRVVVIQ